jgi:hypothetical protein
MVGYLTDVVHRVSFRHPSGTARERGCYYAVDRQAALDNPVLLENRTAVAELNVRKESERSLDDAHRV